MLWFFIQIRGEVTGTIDVSLKWKYAYLPPKASTKTLAQVGFGQTSASFCRIISKYIHC